MKLWFCQGTHGKMSGGHSGRSSQGSTWQERRQKQREDREYEEQRQSELRKGSFQTYRTMSSTLGPNRFDRRDKVLEKRDEDLEHLHRLVRDLELEARGRHRRRDYEKRREGSASIGGHHGAGSHQFESHCHRDRSREYADQDSISPEER